MTPASDYRYLTEQCCPSCAHVHPKDEACVVEQARCVQCGFPVGLTYETEAGFAMCPKCLREGEDV